MIKGQSRGSRANKKCVQKFQSWRAIQTKAATRLFASTTRVEKKFEDPLICTFVWFASVYKFLKLQKMGIIYLDFLNFYSDFLRKRNVCWVRFLFSQFTAIEMIFFNNNFSNCIKNIDSRKSNVKKRFTCYRFLQSSGFSRLDHLAMLWTNFCALWNFFHNAENEMLNIFATRFIPHNKIVRNWIEAS